MAKKKEIYLSEFEELVVKEMASEIHFLTGMNVHLVDPNEKWWNGLCFDTSAVMLNKMLGGQEMYEEQISRLKEHHYGWYEKRERQDTIQEEQEGVRFVYQLSDEDLKVNIHSIYYGMDSLETW